MPVGKSASWQVVLILALGFTGADDGPDRALERELGVAVAQRGNLAVDDQYATSVAGVFAAGYAHRGASLVVWAIAGGREAAPAIDGYLRGGAESWLPSRRVDLPFGGG